MKRLLILTALAVPMWAQPAFDFKTLDKFDALTNKKTKVTLDAGMLGEVLGEGAAGLDDAAKRRAAIGR